MELSKACSYGLTAVCVLGKSEGLVKAERIARQYDIPREYLLKVMQKLGEAGIVKGKRGPHGGLSLARPTTKITMQTHMMAQCRS